MCEQYIQFLFEKNNKSIYTPHLFSTNYTSKPTFWYDTLDTVRGKFSTGEFDYNP